MKNSINWAIDTDVLESDLFKLFTEKPKYQLNIDCRKFVRGKQYARPFTYIKTYSAIGTLSEEKQVSDEEYSFTASFVGIGDITQI